MYSSNSVEFQNEAPSLPPTAPPYALPLPAPLAFPEPITTQDNQRNQTNNSTARNFHPLSPIPWSTGLCDCCDNVSTCFLTCLCPCVTFGRIAEIVDRGSTSCGLSGTLYSVLMCLTGWPCLYSCFYRSKMRGQYLLEERPCTDCCVHCFCEQCALCQEYRELMHYGFDMSIGWHGNMARRQRLAAIEGSKTRNI